MANHAITATYNGDTNFTASTGSLVGGQQVNLVPTTITLTSSSNPAFELRPITYTATVNSNFGQPTGTVTFSFSATPVALSGNSATATVAGFTQGTLTVTATYNGAAGQYATSTVTLAGGQVVVLAPTTLTLTTSANPSFPSQAVVFQASVTSPAGAPTIGTVQFIVDGTNLGGATPLSGGSAFSNSTALLVGFHNVVATYSAGSQYASSTSTLTQQSELIPTTMTVVSSDNSSWTNQPLAFTATVSSPSGTPSGFVQFFDNGTLIGSGGSLFGGQFTQSGILLALGNHIITATYNPTSNFGGCTGTLAGGQFVDQIPTTLTLASSKNPSLAGEGVFFTATVSSPLGTPFGVVQFNVDGATFGPTVGLNGGVAVSQTNLFLGLGSHTITATYGSVAQWGASAGALSGAQDVISATTLTGLTSSHNPSVVGEPITFTAIVTSTVAVPTGGVNFSVDGTVVSSPALTNGSATFTSSTLTAGAHSVVATYTPSNGAFGASTGSLPSGQQVNASVTTTVVTSAVNPSLFGQAISFTATVSSGAGTPTGSVQFTVDGANSGAPVALSGGSAVSVPDASLAQGQHSISASYTGNFTSSIAAPITQTVNRPATSVALNAAVDPSVLGQAVTFTAVVSSIAGTPTGSVQFTIDGTNSGAPVALAGGSAVSAPVTSLAQGVHSVSASYTGNFSSSNATPITQTVNKAVTTVALVSSVDPSTLGQAVTFTATATTLPAATPTGSVTFLDGASTLGVTALNGSGIATLTTSTLGAGDHSVTAVYAGDASNSAGTSSALIQSVGKTTVSVVLSSATNPSVYGATVTLTVVGDPTATGTVTLKDGPLVIGTLTLVGGSAGTQFTSLQAGSHSLSAVYSGDASFNPTTTTLTQVVTPAPLTVTAQNATKIYGGANPALTLAYSGFVNGDTLAELITPATVSTTATAASGVGAYPITPAGGIGSNYTFVYVNGSLTVTPAILTVTADPKTRVYAVANPQLTVTYSNFVNADNASVITGSPVITTNATLVSPVGSYIITPALGTLSAANYTFAFVTGPLTITRATPTIVWANPAQIPFGTALSDGQLNATADTGGTFIYSPFAGSILSTGPGQQLSVQFLPTDTFNYTTAFKTVFITVFTPVIITSGPTASPNPVSVGAKVLFTVAATAGSAITWSWDFGDGTLDNTNSATVSHAFTAAGTYTVVASATDTTGLNAKNSVVMTVVVPTIPPGGQVDTDNDGFSDVEEVFLGTDPFDQLSTPVNNTIANPQALTIATLQFRIGFAKTGADVLYLKGVMSLPLGSSLGGKVIVIDAGGVLRKFTLDASGKAKDGYDTFQLNPLTSIFIMKLNRGAFAKSVAATGLAEINAKKLPVLIPVSVLFNKTYFQATRTVLYTATVGKIGTAK